MTKFAILTYGTRGDVQPYIALGLALQRAGHTVRLAAPEVFRDLVTGYGLGFHPLPGDPGDLMQQAADRAGSSPIRFPLVVLQHALPLALEMLDSVREACQGAEAIVHSLLLTVVGHEMAVEMQVPDFSALIFLTFAPTSAFPAQILPAVRLGGTFNRLTHAGFIQLFWQANRLAYAFLRRKNRQLPPLSGWPFGPASTHPTPILYALSPQIISRPADWGPDVHLTGYWTLAPEDGWSPPRVLLEFLEAGPAPVFVGFGSLITAKASHLTEVALEALARTGKRGLLVRGWGGIQDRNLPGDVLAVDEVPFEWLFPRMAALVHHGGVGTTAAGLRSGVPAVVVSSTADQPYWGYQLQRVGVGPPPIPLKRLTADRLVTAIEQLTSDEGMRQQAARLGRLLHDEDGVGRAVEIIERYLSGAGCASAHR
ncbi:MAG: glycosyltransferase [Anaerolineae bacterium]|nr:glycosyltransferase [Anaerolineae bacterium]